MKSFRDDLIDRMKTGWGRFVLASLIPLGYSLVPVVWVAHVAECDGALFVLFLLVVGPGGRPVQQLNQSFFFSAAKNNNIPSQRLKGGLCEKYCKNNFAIKTSWRFVRGKYILGDVS